MNIGIVTFWTSKDNFGQILQLFALQTFLKKNGHSAILIRTSNLNSKPCIKIRIKRNIKAILNVVVPFNFQALGGRNFDLFLKKNVSFTDKIFYSSKNFTPTDLQYDAVICGSDVVWSEGVGTGDWGNLCFLDFVTAPTKKISYAASFGASELSKNFSEFIKPLIKKFDAISVREESGVDICAKLGRPDAVSVCDPTLLLQKSDYDNLLVPSNIEHQTAFAYFIGWDTEIPEQEIKQYVKENNWSFSRLDSQIHKKSLKQLFVKPKSIPEWLQTYRDAPCIFTNSFHGTIFALIFKKPFLFFPIKGAAQKLNNRVENLLGKFGLINRIWLPNKSIQEQMDKPIDWLQVYKNIEDFRIFSLNWLKIALEK